MQIICITENLGSGGAERQLIGLANLLQKQNHNVKFITYIKNQFYIDKINQSHISYEYINGDTKMRRFIAIRRFLKKNNPDLVISFLPSTSQWVILSKLTGLKFKLIVSERSSTINSNFRNYIKFNLYRFSDAIVVNSYSETNNLINRFSFLKPKIKTITNFVDLEIFTPNNEYSFQNNILVVGRLVPIKNCINFLKALKIIKDRGFEINVRWVGDQSNLSYKHQVIDYVKNNNLIFFKLIEPVSNIEREYQSASIFCLPSIYEGYPNVICEAMSCGLPIICSSICDNNLLVNPGENGEVFNPNIPEDIADKIIKLITMDKEFIIQMRKNNINKSKQLFSKESFINKYMNIIHNLY